MTTRTKAPFVCAGCGADHPKWQGRCGECGEWDSLTQAEGPRPAPRPGGSRAPLPLTRVDLRPSPRVPTGLREFDRVLGGGLVAGSAILVAGEPGIGKSTLLLQASGGFAAGGGRVLYVSGEESPAQVRMRAERLGIADDRILLAGETDLGEILAAARSTAPDLLVVDSIQTVVRCDSPGAPGSVTQIRDGAAELTAFAKETGTPLVLIGHVTKTGEVAGPQVLSHVVDAVLTFEGDRYHVFRVLRARKNRFGATEEVGIFEMRPGGLAEVAGPAGLLLGVGTGGEAGSVVVPVVEGTRVLLLEVQALGVPILGGPPRRRVSGLDPGRVDLLLAVMEKKAGVALSRHDVFLNAVGGVRAEEPGTDLGAALALASALSDRPFPRDTVAFGEVGLLGELRPASRGRARLAEAAKLGFARAIAPPGTEFPGSIRVETPRTLAEALRILEAPDQSVSRMRR